MHSQGESSSDGQGSASESNSEIEDLICRGSGTPLLLIHGSATDRTTWTVQLASLKEEFCMLAYTRRGAHLGRGGEERRVISVEEHADDAADILQSEVEGPCAVVGSSFGAIVALDLARRYPSLVSSLVLCEPPLSSSDYLPSVPGFFACGFDSLAEGKGGEAASEFFLRCVLGDAAFDKMPKAYRHRSMSAYRQIRADMQALSRYQTNYEKLAGEIGMPCYLVGGENSAAFYRDTLDALHLAIPQSQLRILRGAGHMMHVEAYRQFHELLRAL